MDLSDAPVPPPRATPAANHSNFVSNITKNDVKQETDFHTSTIRFTGGKDKAKLKLTLSSKGKVSQTSAQPCNGSAPKPAAPFVASRPSQDSRVARPVARPAVAVISKGKIQEVIVICAFVVISILYLVIKNKLIANLP